MRHRATSIFVFTSLALCAIFYIAAAMLMAWLFPWLMFGLVAFIGFLFGGVWLIEKLSEKRGK
jgi:hypothetical protein